MNEVVTANAWYRYPWVWFVFCIPLTAVAFGVVMITAANYQPDDLVVDNYYKEGKGINQRLGEDKLAKQLGIAASLTAITPEGLVFTINGGGSTIDLALFHVTDRDQDLRVPLQVQGGDLFTAESAILAERLRNPGVWYIQLQGVDQTGSPWRLRDRLETPVSTLTFKAKS